MGQIAGGRTQDSEKRGGAYWSAEREPELYRCGEKAGGQLSCGLRQGRRPTARAQAHPSLARGINIDVKMHGEVEFCRCNAGTQGRRQKRQRNVCIKGQQRWSPRALAALDGRRALGDRSRRSGRVHPRILARYSRPTRGEANTAWTDVDAATLHCAALSCRMSTSRSEYNRTQQAQLLVASHRRATVTGGAQRHNKVASVNPTRLRSDIFPLGQLST